MGNTGFYEIDFFFMFQYKISKKFKQIFIDWFLKNYISIRY